MDDINKKTKARAFVATIQVKNMQKMGLAEEDYKDPEYLADHLRGLWDNSGKGRTSAVAVCESADGLYHAHMALYGNTTTLNNAAKILCQSHVEPQYGGKQALSGYFSKTGIYAEKGEKVLLIKGLENLQDAQGKRSDIQTIEEMLLKGYTPQQILSSNFSFYRFEKMILRAYTDQRIQDAPRHRDIYAEYHVGDSSTGKTFVYICLCEEYGRENIYLLTDYDNNLSGGLDSYMKEGAPDILFMDELKGFGVSYGKLLTMLNGYPRMQTHSRYTNTYNLWSKVYITSVYPPELIYQNMVSAEHRDVDSYQQFLRRIDKIVYHYKIDEEYHTYPINSTDYIDYADLRRRAEDAGREERNGFERISDTEQLALPFKD